MYLPFRHRQQLYLTANFVLWNIFVILDLKGFSVNPLYHEYEYLLISNPPSRTYQLKQSTHHNKKYGTKTPKSSFNSIAMIVQVLLAAAYLDDAKTGRHMEFESSVSAVRMYSTYKSWWFTGILYLSLAVILCLAIFEEPTIQKFQDFATHKFWAPVSFQQMRF